MRDYETVDVVSGRPEHEPEEYISEHLKELIEKYPDVKYFVLFGQRSNGKTFGTLWHCLEEYIKYGNEMAYIRRTDEDLRGQRGDELFAGLEKAGIIKELTGGEWTGVSYYSKRWYLCKHVTNKKGEMKIVKDIKPFCYGFALNTWEHEKGASFPNVTNICFDEFLSRVGYLRDEFVTYMNVLSTIIRHRDNVKIFMLGNSVNMYCPYEEEMGLYRFRKMKQGTFDIYTYGDTGLKLLLYWCPNRKENGHIDPSDVYFAFKNPKLKMITTGSFEMDIYPHLPCGHHIKPKDIIFTCYVIFAEDILQLQVCCHDGLNYMFICPKTTEIKNPDTDIVCYTEADIRPNWRVGLGNDKIGKQLKWYFANNKVFYRNNLCGEIMRNFLEETK